MGKEYRLYIVSQIVGDMSFKLIYLLNDSKSMSKA